MPTKQELLSDEIEHIDITRARRRAAGRRDAAHGVHAPATWPAPPTSTTACSATASAASSSAWPARWSAPGLKKVFVDMIRNHMVDCHRQHRGQHRRPGFLRRAWASSITWPPSGSRPGMDDDAAARPAHRPHLRHADRRGRAAGLRRHDAADRRRACRRGRIRSREFIREMGAYLERARQDARLASCWRPTRTTCRSSARRFPIARPASAWWPISTPAATARR